MRGKRPKPFEAIWKKKDGTIHPAEVHINLMKKDGKTIGFQAISRDITERKQAEKKLLEYADHLEELVKEKTGELLDSERMATAGRVAAMVGHDLKGPLQSIYNAVFLLKKSPEGIDESLKIIEGSVNRANQMIEEFRSRTRDTPLHIVPTNLEALIKKTVEETSKPGHVEVTIKLGVGLEEIQIDPLKMRRVLDNLIWNAVEAMPQGGTLALSARAKDDTVVIEVCDTGVGLPEEEMGNLFKSFYTTKPGGMGLGLAYCKRAVEAHGGTITAESEVGEGTTFTIKLPYVLERSKN